MYKKTNNEKQTCRELFTKKKHAFLHVKHHNKWNLFSKLYIRRSLFLKNSKYFSP